MPKPPEPDPNWLAFFRQIRLIAAQLDAQLDNRAEAQDVRQQSG